MKDKKGPFVKDRQRWIRRILCLGLLSLPWLAQAESPAVIIGERPALEQHMDQEQIEYGKIQLRKLIDHGQRLFDARFNVLDGQGRPASTGTGAPRSPHQPAFVRTSAPDANSCAGCHNQAGSGGGGDFVANVFVLAQALDPVTFSTAPEFSNERNTLGMFGSGAIEMLAREMSFELIAIREAATAAAATSGVPVTSQLLAKGVDFGQVTVMPDGKVDPSAIEGVDWDLIIKPFHQKGAVVSLREFTNNAMNHHHGMQSVERFGQGLDPDLDGVFDELSVGDITAATIFQASLAVPGPVESPYPERRHAALRGEALFEDIGCGSCHRPTLALASSQFSEPNPFNPPGNLRPGDVEHLLVFDLAEGVRGRNLKRTAGGGALVHAFTDLKRHNLNDAELDHFDNELIAQGTLAGFANPGDFTVANQPRPTGEFLTRKLWDVGDSAPYGHRGDLTTLTQAIHFHGGQARSQRDAFFDLPSGEQAAIIEFMMSLRASPLP